VRALDDRHRTFLSASSRCSRGSVPGTSAASAVIRGRPASRTGCITRAKGERPEGAGQPNARLGAAAVHRVGSLPLRPQPHDCSSAAPACVETAHVGRPLVVSRGRRCGPAPGPTTGPACRDVRWPLMPPRPTWACRPRCCGRPARDERFSCQDGSSTRARSSRRSGNDGETGTRSFDVWGNGWRGSSRILNFGVMSMPAPVVRGGYRRRSTVRRSRLSDLPRSSGENGSAVLGGTGVPPRLHSSSKARTGRRSHLNRRRTR
jgi:hypothetical protein